MTLPRQIVDQLFDPTIPVDKLDLNQFIQTDAVDQDKVEQSVDQKVAVPLEDVPRPLTREESEEVDKRISFTRARVAAQLQRIHETKKRIDSLIPAGFQFSLDISKQPTLKRAIQKVFGIKTNTITYEMYKEVIEAKKLLEKGESEVYLNGAS